jgi:hypothetical protein
MLEKLKLKWRLQNLYQVVLVLIVFSLTGTTVVVLRPALFAWLGLGAETAGWIKTLAYITFIFPAYQLLLLGYGFMLGQFSFFWQKERQMWQRIEKIFAGKQ